MANLILDYFDPTRDYSSSQPDDATASITPMQSSISASVKATTEDFAETLKVIDGTDHDSHHERQQELSALKDALAHTQCQYLVVSFTTDWRFAPERSQEIVDALMATGKPVSYINIDAPHGHDSFLFDIPRYMGAVRGFLTAPFITPSRPATGERS